MVLVLKWGGGRIIIHTSQDENNYVVVIKDNGVGFDYEQVINNKKGHIGIKNTKIRLREMINATLDIESKINEGTKIRISIPKKEK